MPSFCATLVCEDGDESDHFDTAYLSDLDSDDGSDDEVSYELKIQRSGTAVRVFLRASWDGNDVTQEESCDLDVGEDAMSLGLINNTWRFFIKRMTAEPSKYFIDFSCKNSEFT